MKQVLILTIFSIFLTSCAVKSEADPLNVEIEKANFSNNISTDDELPFSPFEIKKLVDQNDSLDVTQFWQRIGLEDGQFNKVGKDDFDVVKTSINKDNLDDAVLVVWSSLTSNARIVLFGQQANFSTPQEQWKFVSYVEIPDQKYKSPIFQVVQNLNKHFLVVRQIKGWGTGVSLYKDFFYEIKAGELSSVFDFPSEGHDVNNKPWDRTYESKLIKYSGDEIEVEFNVDWKGNDYDEPKNFDTLFAQSRKAVFKWDESKNQFFLNASKSEITEQELNEVYNFDTIDEKNFLKYTSKDLLSIAEKGSPSQKEWLRKTLERMNETQAVRQIKDVLNKK